MQVYSPDVPDPGTMDTLSLKRDIGIIMNMTAMFEGNDGRMVGLGAPCGDKTFKECFEKVRAYDINEAFSLNVNYAEEMQRMDSLEENIKKMNDSGLSETRDFRMMQDRLTQIKHTLKGRKDQLDAQKQTAESRYADMLHKILRHKTNASSDLRTLMGDGKTTIDQAKTMWMNETKGRI